MTEQPNVVLTHSAFADGSSWSAVVEDLQAKGKPVTALQLPLTSLADDVARLRQAPAWRSGPTIVVGYSPTDRTVAARGSCLPSTSKSGKNLENRLLSRSRSESIATRSSAYIPPIRTSGADLSLSSSTALANRPRSQLLPRS